MTLNGWSLTWCMSGNVTEFHLVTGPVARIGAEGMMARLWVYNGRSTVTEITAE